MFSSHFEIAVAQQGIALGQESSDGGQVFGSVVVTPWRTGTEQDRTHKSHVNISAT
jgi:hypothetical protein